ncbi:MAG: hypothetical protein ACW99Q_16060 [Candidatus Kariarchaeaceae archaeon]|jgi:hypothetical protein
MKNLRNTSRLVFIVILVFALILGFPFFQSLTQKVNHEVDTLTTSAGEITIITPENITYTDPMDGFFPGTYGFENDEVGSLPQDWYLGNLFGNVEPQIIANIGSHNKILELYDDGGGQSVIIQNFSEGVQSYGTVEFWMRNSDATDGNAIRLRYIDNTNMGPAFSMIDDKWVYSLDSGPYDIVGLPTPQDNIWYHITVHFEARIAGGYHGLNQYEYEIIVNGLNSSGALPFRHNVSVDQIVFFTGSTASNYYFYIDALGYSWNPGYNVGDNMNEGLLLSYDNSTALDWKGFSLDGLTNTTVLGNSTIPLPSNGIHTIQVYGNNSIGTIYESNLRYFTVDYTPPSYNISIITPENKTYTNPMSGYYPATYGFESDIPGQLPFGWTDSSTGGTMQIIDSVGGHTRVLELYDNTGSGQCVTGNRFDVIGAGPQTFGTIELWMRSTDVNKGLTFSGRSLISLNIGLQFRIYQNTWENVPNGGPTPIPNLPTPQSNRWYHVQVNFDCRSGGGYKGLNQYEYEVILDGIASSGALSFRDTPSSLDYIVIFTGAVNSGYYTYIDALSYSFDTNHNIGDNTNEGLLLSYDNTTALDWTGFSLDGLTNTTIRGNKTIVLPDNGLHTIQVFGNNSIGSMYGSNHRYFTIDYTPPNYNITINTPGNTTYTGPMNGYYPGTYSFENDEIGSIPQDWYLGNLYGNVEPQIIPNIGGHNKILELYDDGGGQSVVVQDFSEGVQPYGSVQFWMRNSDATDANAIKLRYIDNTNIGPAFMMKDDKWAYALDSGNYDIVGLPTPQDNVWYHITIHFEARVAGGYHGLNQYEYEIIVNNAYSSGALPFRHNTQVDQIVFFTGSTMSNYYFYIDALGYSWHSGYNVGDNMKEGLLLSFDNTTALDWVGYSLDGQSNKTITGDSTIVMPNDGIHTIQVFGSTPLGENHMSRVKYFSMAVPPEIVINSPAPSNVFGSNAPSFDVSITDLNLLSTWYSIDDGITNITFTGSLGSINQNEWNQKSDGLVIITFYASDTAGHESSAEVTIFKDTTVPIDGPGNLILIISILVGVFSLIGIISVIIVLKRVRTPSETIEPREAKPKKLKEKKPKTSKKKAEDLTFICPFCQNTLPVRQKFCTYCGTSLQEEKQ